MEDVEGIEGYTLRALYRMSVWARATSGVLCAPGPKHGAGDGDLKSSGNGRPPTLPSSLHGGGVRDGDVSDGGRKPCTTQSVPPSPATVLPCGPCVGLPPSGGPPALPPLLHGGDVPNRDAGCEGLCAGAPSPQLASPVVLPSRAPPADLPSVTSVSYIVVECGPGWERPTVAAALHPDLPRQCASVSKVVTFMVAAAAVNDGKVAWEDAVTVSALAAGVHGTSAGLSAGDTFTLLELCFGLMLPSGNDAATAIAEHVGAVLPAVKALEEPWGDGPHYDGSWSRDATGKHPVLRFVAAMNTTVAALGAARTTFANPHGLMNEHHTTCAADVLAWSLHALRTFPLLTAIGATKKFSCTTSAGRAVTWTNTNRLLSMKCRGVTVSGLKTGITPAAGGCLVSVSTPTEGAPRTIVAVTLGSNNKTLRFIDNLRLVEAVATT